MAIWREQWLVCGVPGSGKSYFAHKLAERSCNVKKTKDRLGMDFTTDNKLWVYDPTGQWEHEKTVRGIPMLPFEERESWPFVVFGDEDLTEACETIKADGDQGAIMLFDECLTIENADYPAIKRLCTLRRHRGVELIFCTQRPRAIPVPIVSMCSQVVSFQIHHPDDIQRLKAVLQPDDLERLPTLALPNKNKPPEFVHRDLSGKSEARP